MKLGKELTEIRSPQRKHRPDSRTGNAMPTSLRGIANKARKDANYRFGNLYTMLTVTNLLYCWQYVNKKAVPGVDKFTAQEYEKNLLTHVTDLVERLKRKAYRAKLVLRKWIPKSKDKKRPLGLPVIEDKLLQTCVAKILEAIFDSDFFSFSYGYRQHHSPREAALALREKIQIGRFRYLVEADIKGFFNNIDHNWMMRMLEQRINDHAFLRLIVKWLKAGILEEDGTIFHPVTGTPQGGVVSAILANIYLHYALDLWFEEVVRKRCRGMVYLCRFADDFVCVFEYKSDADMFYRWLPKRLGKFNLELSLEKTNLISFSRFPESDGSSFEFLGFEYRWGLSYKRKKIVKMRTSPTKFRQSLARFTEWIRTHRSQRIRRLLKTLNSKLRGFYNYYGVINNYVSLHKYYQQVRRILFKWLNRRSQRKSYNWQQFSSMLLRHHIETPRITERRNPQLCIEFF
jgi:group II intron reverse transcriptase/maturase